MVIMVAVPFGFIGEIQAPMARVNVSGLLTSTAVKLILVPCLYVL